MGSCSKGDQSVVSSLAVYDMRNKRATHFGSAVVFVLAYLYVRVRSATWLEDQAVADCWRFFVDIEAHVCGAGALLEDQAVAELGGDLVTTCVARDGCDLVDISRVGAGYCCMYTNSSESRRWGVGR